MAVRVDHLTILVSDWDDYEVHYAVLLPLVGFTRLDKTIWSDGEGFFLQFGQARDGTRSYERYGAGLNHWGVKMPTRDSVDDLRAALIAAGLKVQPVQDLGGARALFVPDSDGLRAEFTYYPDGMDPVG